MSEDASDVALLEDISRQAEEPTHSALKEKRKKKAKSLWKKQNKKPKKKKSSSSSPSAEPASPGEDTETTSAIYKAQTEARAEGDDEFEMEEEEGEGENMEGETNIPVETFTVNNSNIGSLLSQLHEDPLSRVLVISVPKSCLKLKDTSLLGAQLGEIMRYKTNFQRTIKAFTFFFAQAFLTYKPSPAQPEKDAVLEQYSDKDHFFLTSVRERPGFQVKLPRTVVVESKQFDETNYEYQGFRFFYVVLDPAIDMEQSFTWAMEQNYTECTVKKGKQAPRRLSAKPDSWVDYRASRQVRTPEKVLSLMEGFKDVDAALSPQDTSVQETRFSGEDNINNPLYFFSLKRLYNGITTGCVESKNTYFSRAFSLHNDLQSDVSFYCETDEHGKTTLCLPTQCIFEVLGPRLIYCENLNYREVDVNKPINSALKDALIQLRLTSIQVEEGGGNYVEEKQEMEDLERRLNNLYRKMFEREKNPNIFEGYNNENSSSEGGGGNQVINDIGLEKLSVSEEIQELDTIEKMKVMNTKLYREFSKHLEDQLESLCLRQTELDTQMKEDYDFIFREGEEGLKEYQESMEALEKAKDKLKEQIRKSKILARKKASKELIEQVILNPGSASVHLSDPLKGIIHRFNRITKGNTDCSAFWSQIKFGREHCNLSYFGSFIVRLWTCFFVSCRVKPTGENIRHLFNILLACWYSWFFEIDPEDKTPMEDRQTYGYTMKGEYEASKTFLMLCASLGLDKSTLLDLTHMTEKSVTVGHGCRDYVYMQHEANDFLGDSSILKDCVKGYTTSLRPIKDPETGEWKQQRQVTLLGISFIKATNDMSIVKNARALDTRQQIETVEKTDTLDPSDKINMHKLINELTMETLKQIAGPFGDMLKNIQFLIAMVAIFVRSRVMDPIVNDNYRIVSTMFLEELEKMGYQDDILLRDIKRGEALAETLGYLNAIVTEYFSPMAAKQHQWDPKKYNFSRPFNFHSILERLSKRLYVSVDCAVMAISLLNNQFVKQHRNSLLKNLLMFVKRRMWSRRRRPGTVCADPDEVVLSPFFKTGNAYNPVKHYDPLFLTATEDNVAQFRVTRTSKTNTGITILTYDPNYYRLVVNSPDKKPLETLAEVVARENGNHSMRTRLSNELLSLSGTKGLYDCTYWYPERKAFFYSNNRSPIDPEKFYKTVNGSAQDNPEYLKYLRSLVAYPKKEKRPIMFKEVTDQGRYEIFILREALDTLTGKREQKNPMKTALENVVRRFPEHHYDIPLFSLHYGPTIDGGGHSTYSYIPSVLEVTRTNQHKYRNKEWFKQAMDKLKGEKGAEPKLQNPMPVLSFHSDLLTDGMNPALNSAVRNAFQDGRISQEEFVLDQNLDEAALKQRAARMGLEYDDHFEYRNTLKYILGCQLALPDGHMPDQDKLYPDFAREVHTESKRRTLQTRNPSAGARYAVISFCPDQRTQKEKEHLEQKKRIEDYLKIGLPHGTEVNAQMPPEYDDEEKGEEKEKKYLEETVMSVEDRSYLRLQLLRDKHVKPEQLLKEIPLSQAELENEKIHSMWEQLILSAKQKEGRGGGGGEGGEDLEITVQAGYSYFVNSELLAASEGASTPNMYLDKILKTEDEKVSHLFSQYTIDDFCDILWKESVEKRLSDFVVQLAEMEGDCMRECTMKTIRRLCIDQKMYERMAQRYANVADLNETLRIMRKITKNDPQRRAFMERETKRMEALKELEAFQKAECTSLENFMKRYRGEYVIKQPNRILMMDPMDDTIAEVEEPKLEKGEEDEPTAENLFDFIKQYQQRPFTRSYIVSLPKPYTRTFMRQVMADLESMHAFHQNAGIAQMVTLELDTIRLCKNNIIRKNVESLFSNRNAPTPSSHPNTKIKVAVTRIGEVKCVTMTPQELQMSKEDLQALRNEANRYSQLSSLVMRKIEGEKCKYNQETAMPPPNSPSYGTDKEGKGKEREGEVTRMPLKERMAWRTKELQEIEKRRRKKRKAPVFEEKVSKKIKESKKLAGKLSGVIKQKHTSE